MNMIKKILHGLVCRTLAMAAIVLAVVVSCTKANPYEGLSLVLSGVPENMTVGDLPRFRLRFPVLLQLLRHINGCHLTLRSFL